MLRRLLVLAAVAAPAFADRAAFDAAWKKADRRAAAKLVAIGKKALKENQGATANRIFRRALELQDEQRAAMKYLGYKRVKGEYRRTLASRSSVATRKDDDYELIRARRADVSKVERVRARGILKAAEEYLPGEDLKKELLPLLDHVPRLAALHEKLGHERHGANYVRPELSILVRMLPGRLRSWRACSVTPVRPEATDKVLSIYGLDKYPRLYQVGDRIVAATWGEESARIAADTEAPYKLTRLLLGPQAATWNPERVYLMDEGSFQALIHSLYASPAKRKAALEYSTFYGEGYFAQWARTTETASPHFSFTCGWRSMAANALPPDPRRPGKSLWTAYPWIKEAYACLLSYELWGECTSFTASSDETSGKVDAGVSPLLPVDQERTGSGALALVRENILHEAAYPMREVFGRSLNNLDRLATLQAWSFLRFLFLYDPVGSKKFIPALARQEKGPMPDRVDRALKEAYGKDTVGLEPIWRHLMLEIR